MKYYTEILCWVCIRASVHQLMTPAFKIVCETLQQIISYEKKFQVETFLEASNLSPCVSS